MGQKAFLAHQSGLFFKIAQVLNLLYPLLGLRITRAGSRMVAPYISDLSWRTL